MKRSDFLKKLGIGIGVAVVAPKALAGMPSKEEEKYTVIREEPEFYFAEPESGSLFYEINGCGIAIDSDIMPTNYGCMIEFDIPTKLKDFLVCNDLICIDGKFLNSDKKYEAFLITRRDGVHYRALPLLSDCRVVKTIPKETLIYWQGNLWSDHPTKL